jgi:signal transduction histidine kinase
MLWQQPLWALPFALFFGILFATSPHAWLVLYEASLVFAFLVRIAIIAARFAVVPRLRARFAGATGRGAFPGWWMDGVVYVTAAMTGGYAAAYVIHLTLIPGFLGSPRAVLISGMYSLLFSVLFSGIAYAIAFYHEAVDRARAVEQARAELARAELRALRAQINPHFLFNTLNTIAALIAENPAAAEEVTTRLAETFRYTLATTDRTHTPLGEELEFVRSLIAIERVRFGERLRVEEAIEPGLEAVPVPSLLLQPLVENAIQHGAGASPEGATVRISARRDGDRLVLEVADDGPGFSPGGTSATRGSGQGFGLRSVRERLEALGPPHALEIDSPSGRGARVRVTLPVTPAATAGVAPLHLRPGDSPCD